MYGLFKWIWILHSFALCLRRGLDLSFFETGIREFGSFS